MGYDLGFRTAPGRFLTPSEFDQLLEDFDKETDLDGPCEITRHDSEPDQHDLAYALSACLEWSKAERREFEAFCAARQISLKQQNAELLAAAHSFMIAKHGQNVFFLKLPPSEYEDEVRDAYRKIVDFACRHQLVVDDPQIGDEIDLDNPGEFPPMWGTPHSGKHSETNRKWWKWWQ